MVFRGRYFVKSWFGFVNDRLLVIQKKAANHLWACCFAFFYGLFAYCVPLDGKNGILSLFLASQQTVDDG